MAPSNFSSASTKFWISVENFQTFIISITLQPLQNVAILEYSNQDDDDDKRNVLADLTVSTVEAFKVFSYIDYVEVLI